MKDAINAEKVREGLKWIQNKRALSSHALSQYVGLDPSNLTKKMDGRQPITSRDLKKFEEANINPDFLLTGNGAPFIGQFPKQDLVVYRSNTGIPIYDEEFGCGYLDFNDAATRPSGYVSIPGLTGIDLGVPATGSSMEPTIHNGDYIFLKRIRHWDDFIAYGEIYAIDCENDIRTVKRIKRGSVPGKILLVADNPGYPSQEIDISVIRNLFQVMATLHVV